MSDLVTVPSRALRALLLVGAVLAAPLAAPASAQDRWLPLDEFELDPVIGPTVAGSGLAYVPWTDSLVLTVANANGQFAELTTDGALLGFFDFSPSPGVTLDNGGLAVLDIGNRLQYVNGLAPTAVESIQQFNVDGTGTTSTPSDVLEAGALARHPITGELYVYDIVGRQLRRMSYDSGSYSTTSSATLPAAIFGVGDAGMAYNPRTLRLAAAGEAAPNNGIVYDMEFDGTIVGELVDTGITAGISALDFDKFTDRMFVRTRLGGRRVHVFKRSPLFDDLGNALAGSNGEPQLVGASTLEGLDPVLVELTSARPSSPAVFVLGTSAINAPFKGGVFVPSPDILVMSLSTNAAGELSVLNTWPAGVPAGIDLYLQFWIPDPAGTLGYAASNGVTATTM